MSAPAAAPVSTASTRITFRIGIPERRSSALENRVDERRQRRTLREDQQRADHDHHQDDGHQPPLLPFLHERPQLANQTTHTCLLKLSPEIAGALPFGPRLPVT